MEKLNAAQRFLYPLLQMCLAPRLGRRKKPPKTYKPNGLREQARRQRKCHDAVTAGEGKSRDVGDQG